MYEELASEQEPGREKHYAIAVCSAIRSSTERVSHNLEWE